MYLPSLIYNLGNFGPNPSPFNGQKRLKQEIKMSLPFSFPVSTQKEVD